MNGTVKKLVIVPENKEVCDSKEILTELHKFYSNLFERKRDVTLEKCKCFLDTINVPTILIEHKEKSVAIPIILTALTNKSIFLLDCQKKNKYTYIEINVFNEFERWYFCISKS